VEYSYRVEGRDYHGSRIACGKPRFDIQDYTGHESGRER
jgi:hypothetical protein